VRGFIQDPLRQQFAAGLGRTRHERSEGEPKRCRNATRERQLLGSFGPVQLSVPRARMAAAGGARQQWRSASLPQAKQRASLRKWQLKCPGVATSLQEAGDRLFAFLRPPPSQCKSARTTNAIKRLHKEVKRRVKRQTVLPSANTAAMLFRALLASGQITRRKANGWQSLGETFAASIPVELAA